MESIDRYSNYSVFWQDDPVHCDITFYLPIHASREYKAKHLEFTSQLIPQEVAGSVIFNKDEGRKCAYGNYRL